MSRDSGGRRDTRRPRRGRDRDRDRDRDPAATKERIEKEFTREIEMRLTYFLQSEEPELEFEPMNSYRRRVVHTVAKKFELESESRGEDRERYVCVKRTGATPAAAPVRVRMWDYGHQTFPVNPGPKGVRMALKADGSLEILRDDDHSQVLDERVVTSREFRVRQGKILVPGDPDY